jgi:hypothetical protein
LASCFQRLSSCEPFGPLVLTNSDWVLWWHTHQWID